MSIFNYTPENISKWTRAGMRKSFGLQLSELAGVHENLIALTADVASSSSLNVFAEKFPERFFNLGVSEQNMIGVASGLAKENNNVFVCTFAPFVSMRAYEAIKILVCYMNLNVKIIALSSGFSLGVQGNTHYCFEDISLMRTLPNMKIFSPADVLEEAAILEHTANLNTPAFVRLTGLDGTPGIFKSDPDFIEGELKIIREPENNKDVAIISTGSVINECVRAARALKRENISCAVFNASTLKPFDDKKLKEISREYKIILTVEEHFLSGGLGGIVSEILAGDNEKQNARLIRLGIDDKFPLAGNYANMLEKSGLNANGIINAIKNACSKN